MRRFVATTLIAAIAGVAALAKPASSAVRHYWSFRTPDRTVLCATSWTWVECQGNDGRRPTVPLRLERVGKGRFHVGSDVDDVNLSRSIPALRLTTPTHPGDVWLRAGITCTSALKGHFQSIACSGGGVSIWVSALGSGVGK